MRTLQEMNAGRTRNCPRYRHAAARRPRTFRASQHRPDCRWRLAGGSRSPEHRGSSTAGRRTGRHDGRDAAGSKPASGLASGEAAAVPEALRRVGQPVFLQRRATADGLAQLGRRPGQTHAQLQAVSSRRRRSRAMATTAGEWSNWSGLVRCQPRKSAGAGRRKPGCRGRAHAPRHGQTVRVAGSGHSFTPLCATDDVLLSLDRIAGIESVDAADGPSLDSCRHARFTTWAVRWPSTAWHWRIRGTSTCRPSPARFRPARTARGRRSGSISTQVVGAADRHGRRRNNRVLARVRRRGVSRRAGFARLAGRDRGGADAAVAVVSLARAVPPRAARRLPGQSRRADSREPAFRVLLVSGRRLRVYQDAQPHRPAADRCRR